MRGYLGLFLTLLLAGCASTAPLGPVDLAEPGWQLRQGQAIWKTGNETPEIVGDLLLATHPSGSVLRFSKTLPIMNARWQENRWEIEFPPQDRRYSGRGNPPKRIAWFNLLKGIEGRELPEPWIFSGGDRNSMLLVNERSGERIEVHFHQ